jgi:hypothetical protein
MNFNIIPKEYPMIWKILFSALNQIKINLTVSINL